MFSHHYLILKKYCTSCFTKLRTYFGWAPNVSLKGLVYSFIYKVEAFIYRFDSYFRITCYYFCNTPVISKFYTIYVKAGCILPWIYICCTELSSPFESPFDLWPEYSYWYDLNFVEFNEEARRIALERAESVKYAANPVYEAPHKDVVSTSRVVPFRSLCISYELFTVITLVPALIIACATFNR